MNFGIGGLSSVICRLWENVLGQQPNSIGEDDSFLELGGNSLLAMRLANALNRKFNISIPASRVFECNTLHSFAAQLAEEEENLSIIPKLVSNDSSNFCLSFRQECLWQMSKSLPNLTSYNLTNLFRTLTGFQVEKLETALGRLVERHEILRTLIRVSEDGQLFQLIIQTNFKIQTVTVESELELKDELIRFHQTPFELSQDIPIRAKFFIVKDVVSYLGICFHHIATDSWSHKIFMNELCAFYEKDQAELPPLEIQYKDYADFQRRKFTGKLLEGQLSFWKDYLAGFTQLNLSTDFPRTTNYNGKGVSVNFSLDSNISDKILNLAIDWDVSLFSLLLGAFYIMLAGKSKESDITICTSVACREEYQVDELIGLFCMEVPVRQLVDPDNLLEDFVKGVWENMLSVQKNAGLPLCRILAEIGIKIDEDDWNPVSFQLKELEMADCENRIHMENNTEESLIFYNEAVDCELSSFVNTTGPCIQGIFVGASELYCEETVRQLQSNFVSILLKFGELTEDSASRVDDMLNI